MPNLSSLLLSQGKVRPQRSDRFPASEFQLVRQSRSFVELRPLQMAYRTWLSSKPARAASDPRLAHRLAFSLRSVLPREPTMDRRLSSRDNPPRQVTSRDARHEPKALRGPSGRLGLLFGIAAVFCLEVVAAQDILLQRRQMMVEQQVRQRGIVQPEVIDAMSLVPRHLFVPDEVQEQAYADSPLPTPSGQTLSQPYLSARMIELLNLDDDDSVLEIGTGSGYDAAVLSRIAREVHTVEIDPALAAQARQRLAELGYTNVSVHLGDGHAGLPDRAPFDAIILTTAPEEIPPALLGQLKVDGRMVVPVGSFFQDLMVITKTPEGDEKRSVMPIRLGPMRTPPG